MRRWTALLITALFLSTATASAQEQQKPLDQQVQELRVEVETLKVEVGQLKAQLIQLLSQLMQLFSPPGPQPNAVAPAQPPNSSPGYSRTNPAPIGTTLTITAQHDGDPFTAEITLLQVIRGEAAWQMVKQANSLNDPPKGGHEYLLAKVRFRLVTMHDPEARFSLSPLDFTAVSAQGTDYEEVTLVLPDPGIRAALYQGAQHEGWVAFEIREGDNPLITFGRDYQGKGGIWFKTTE